MTNRSTSLRAFRGAIFALAILLVTLVAVTAFARPGGGSSYHGSSRGGGYSSHSSGGYSGGGGGGSGGSALDVLELIVLCIEHPVLGLFIVVIGGGIFVVHVVQSSSRSDWSTASARRDEPEPIVPVFAPYSESPRTQLEALRRFDESFSVPIFEDFVSALYAQVHTARGGGALASFSAYLAPEPLAALARAGSGEVKTIIVGALRILHVRTSREPDPTFTVTVEIEANYTEAPAGGREQAWYVRERWHLARLASAASRTPDRARVFACPSCGAPLEGVIASRCKYCNKEVATGAFDWVVRAIELAEREARGPMLTAETAEEGTDEPSVIDPDAGSDFAALTERDPALRWEAFTARVGLVFAEFQKAWSARDLAAMRPFLSDNLFEVETYWIRAYEAQHLRNVTENARITQLELARVASDKFYDAITIRLFAASLDYTVSTADPGKPPTPERLVCGSRSRERRYSEYWTFLRSARRTGPPRLDRTCPNCGAPLAINMAGNCTYCSAKVTGGDFDWVLSRIEQDESYTG